MRFPLIPQEKKFFELFVTQGEKTKEISRLFREMVNDLGQGKNWADKIKEAEREADQVVHSINALLSKSFVTPFDREDMKSLADVIDDIIDDVEEAANRLVVYQIEESLPELSTFADLAIKACQEISWGTKHLQALKKHPDRLALCCKILKGIEEEGDTLHRTSLGHIMNNPYRKIEWKMKWKDILELCENALDKCEDAAEVFEIIYLKWS